MSRNLRLASGLRIAPRAVPMGARSVATTPGQEPPILPAAVPSTTASEAASSSAGANAGRTTHFGFQTVPEEQKETLGESCE